MTTIHSTITNIQTAWRDPIQNHLLQALPSALFMHLSPHLELVEMPLGALLYESDERLNHIFFPTTAIVSLMYLMEDGATAESAVVGNEGLLGVALFTGGETMPNRAVVHSGGYGYRLKASIFKDQLERGGGRRAGILQKLLLRYTQALLTQMAQTAACNRHHSVVQQLCRLLLVRFDRLPTNELTMTHEQIAHVLGVRREGVTEAASQLRSAGLIDYKRGHISMLNRAGLEAHVCECYRVVKNEYARLLPSAVAKEKSGDEFTFHVHHAPTYPGNISSNNARMASSG